VFCANNAIKLPTTEAQFCIYNRRALCNVNELVDQTALCRCGSALIALFATLPQMQIESSARALVRPDVPIEALMTDFCAIFVVESAAYLLRNPLVFVQKCLYP
jgi:hypothetical protein